MFGAIAIAMAMAAFTALVWSVVGGATVFVRGMVLGLFGAASGASALIWLGFVVQGNAGEVTPPSTVTSQIQPSPSVSSAGQQGGVTAGNIGSVTINPAPAHTDRKAQINDLVKLIEEGNSITTNFETTNDVEQIAADYQVWAMKTEKLLTDELDASYAIQFRNAAALTVVRSGMAIAGAGYWQNARGKIAVLNNFITELRR